MTHTITTMTSMSHTLSPSMGCCSANTRAGSATCANTHAGCDTPTSAASSRDMHT